MTKKISSVKDAEKVVNQQNGIISSLIQELKDNNKVNYKKIESPSLSKFLQSKQFKQNVNTDDNKAERLGPVDTPKSPSKESASKILGSIYKLMRKNREGVVRDRELEKSKRKQEQKDEDKMHDELVESLKELSVEKPSGIPELKPKEKKPETGPKQPSRRPSRPSKGARRFGRKSRKPKGKLTLTGAIGATAVLSTGKATLQKEASGKPQGDISGGQKQFVEKMAPYAEKESKQLRVPPEALLAQWGLESGWGKHVSGDYNYFGIKPGKNWTGEVRTLKTREVINGKEIYIDQPFRSYKSLGEATSDHAKFLKDNPRYSKVLGSSTVEEYAVNIQKAGYATDPNYAKGIIATAARIKPIYSQYAESGKSTNVASQVETPKNTQVASISDTNKNLKDDMSAQKGQQVAVVNTNIVNSSTTQSSPAPKPSREEDKPAYLRKSYG